MRNLFMVILCLPLIAMADDTSVSSATTQSAASSANQQNINFNSPSNVNTNGRLVTTGNAIMPAFSNSFSSDYCGASAGGAVGGMGFSFSMGAPYIDQNCVKLRVTERLMQIRGVSQDEMERQAIMDSALQVVGSINKDVKKVLEEHGLLK